MITVSSAVLGEDYQPISLIGLEFAFRVRIYFAESRKGARGELSVRAFAPDMEGRLGQFCSRPPKSSNTFLCPFSGGRAFLWNRKGKDHEPDTHSRQRA
ncbi:MAG: hypothetical protein ABIS51_18025 [Sphingomonas sp.]